ncbi:MAG: VWA domain-containing protein [bacterium]|nr:VWA domain-containing protein [bacterium]
MLDNIEWVKPGYLPWLWICLGLAGWWMVQLISKVRSRPAKTLYSRFSFWGQSKVLALFIIISAGLIVALARPQKVVDLPQDKSLDILIMADSSFSMLADDIWGARFGRVKKEIRRLVTAEIKSADRVAMMRFDKGVGMVSFFSHDHGNILFRLNNLDIDPEGADAWDTNLSFALSYAFAFLKNQVSFDMDSPAYKKRQVVVILFSDGDDNFLKPAKDEEAKKERDLKIAEFDGILRNFRQEAWPVYTIGVGTLEGTSVKHVYKEKTSVDFGDHPTGLSKEVEKVDKIFTKLQEENLKSISVVTGARYFGLRTSSAEVSTFLHTILEDERQKGVSVITREKQELYWYVLAACAILFLLSILLF